MSILNIEELEQNLDYYVFKVAPKIQLFKENLLDKVLSSVIFETTNNQAYNLLIIKYYGKIQYYTNYHRC